MTTNEPLQRLLEKKYAVTLADMASLKNFKDQLWFVNMLVDQDLLSNLSFVQQQNRVKAMYHLLYAYAHPGTREALCRLCLGVFGEQSTVILDDDPMVIKIQIKNANLTFFYAHYNAAHGQIDDEAYAADLLHALAVRDLSSVATTDPAVWFKQFIPPEVILAELKIGE